LQIYNYFCPPRLAVAKTFATADVDNITASCLGMLSPEAHRFPVPSNTFLHRFRPIKGTKKKGIAYWGSMVFTQLLADCIA
jgi:hypothetical protein